MSTFGFEAVSGTAPGPRRHRRLVVLLVVLLVGVAVLAVGGAVAYGVSRLRHHPAADYPGPGYGTVQVLVHSGDSATAIGQVLLADRVVASVGAFTAAALANTASADIQPGIYRMRLRMSATEALGVLLNPADLVHSTLSVPEGTSLRTLLPLINHSTGISLASLRAAVDDPAALGLPAYAQGHVEGFLFPATYDVAPGTTAVALLRLMVARFEQTAAAVNLPTAAAALGRTPLQVVIIASILERESASPADDPKVAEVFYNRLRVGMPLGSEFTVAYSGNDPTSPYDTYTHKGFPPGPYDSPGQASLQAALHPVSGPWLFFITLPHGGTVFASTDSGFEAARQECISEGGC